MATKKTATPFVLDADATVEQALEALQLGKLTPAQYAEWDRARVARLQADSKGKKKSYRSTTCEVSRAQFLANAKPIKIDLGGGSIAEMDVKEFSKGSFGWGAYGKVDVQVGDKKVKCQMSLNLTVVGSAEAKD